MNKPEKELQPIKKASDTSTKTTIRRISREGKISHERICQVYGAKGEKLDRREESKMSRKEQMTMGRLRSGNNADLMYWLHIIGCAVDNICRKCGVGVETAKHVVYDYPRIHHPPHEPTPPDTLVKDPKKVVRVWEKCNSIPGLPDDSQRESPQSNLSMQSLTTPPTTYSLSTSSSPSLTAPPTTKADTM